MQNWGFNVSDISKDIPIEMHVADDDGFVPIDWVKYYYNQCKNDLKLFVERLIDFLENKQNDYKRILFIISGDLSHTHQEKPYGYSDTSGIFDKLINEWVISGDQIYLDEASTIVNEAKPCGWIGFLLTNEMSQQLEMKYNCKAKRTNIVDACHPSYYGMMVSSFVF